MLFRSEEISDVFIIDIQMPLITGLELIERIVTEKLPIICVILTSYKEFDYAQKAVGLSVFRYLLKPVDEGELSSVLHEIEKETASIEYTNRRREYFSLQKSEGVQIKRIVELPRLGKPILSRRRIDHEDDRDGEHRAPARDVHDLGKLPHEIRARVKAPDRKSTRLNSSHPVISYAVFCLKKKNLYIP